MSHKGEKKRCTTEKTYSGLEKNDSKPEFFETNLLEY